MRLADTGCRWRGRRGPAAHSCQPQKSRHPSSWLGLTRLEWRRKALHVERCTLAGAEQQVQDADIVVKRRIKLLVLRVTRVIHVLQVDVCLLKEFGLDVGAGGRAGKVRRRAS